jgi:hypothetical protein
VAFKVVNVNLNLSIDKPIDRTIASNLIPISIFLHIYSNINAKNSTNVIVANVGTTRHLRLDLNLETILSFVEKHHLD